MKQITFKCFCFLFLAISHIVLAETKAIESSNIRLIVKDSAVNIDGLDNPRDLALSEDKKWLFVASADDNALSVFKVRPDSSLAHYQTVKSSDKIKLEGALSVVSDKSNNVYVLSYYHGALLHFTFTEENGLSLENTLSDDLDINLVFKHANDIKPTQDKLGLLGGYELHINEFTKQLFVASTISHGISIFNINKSGEPSFNQKITTETNKGLEGAVSVTTSKDGYFMAVASMQGKSVSIYAKQNDNKYTLIQLINQHLEMPISVAFSNHAKYLAIVDAMGQTVHVHAQSDNQSFQNTISYTHNVHGLNKVIFNNDGHTFWTFSEKSNQIDGFEIVNRALKHIHTVKVDTLLSPTALVMLDAKNILTAWSKSDALAITKLH